MPLEHRTRKQVTQGALIRSARRRPPTASTSRSTRATPRNVPAAVRSAGRRSHRRHQAREPREVHLARGGRGRPSRAAVRYKVRGEYRPELGLRFNDAKLLLDPYAKAVTGKFRNTDNLLLAYDARPGGGEFVLDTRDNSAVAPKAIVIDDDAFDWQGDARRTSRSSSCSSTRSTSRASRRTRPPA